MKNQQIHQQEKKISDLEKVVGSNKLGQTDRGAHTHSHTSRVPNRVHNYGALISAFGFLYGTNKYLLSHSQFLDYFLCANITLHCTLHTFAFKIISI